MLKKKINQSLCINWCIFACYMLMRSFAKFDKLSWNIKTLNIWRGFWLRAVEFRKTKPFPNEIEFISYEITSLQSHSIDSIGIYLKYFTFFHLINLHQISVNFLLKNILILCSMRYEHVYFELNSRECYFFCFFF